MIYFELNMKNIYILSLFLVFAACNQKQQNNNLKNASFDKNDSILVTFFCGVMDSNVAIRCEKIATIQEQHPKNEYSYVMVNEKLEPYPIVLIDTFIVNKNVIDKIIELVEKRTSAPDFFEDTRMYVTIKKSGRRNDYLCFDHFPYQYKYNGQSCSIDKEALFLLRYYSGYYSWFDERNLDRFEELKDTVYYQKALEQIKMNKWNRSNRIKNRLL